MMRDTRRFERSPRRTEICQRICRKLDALLDQQRTVAQPLIAEGAHPRAPIFDRNASPSVAQAL